MAIKTDVQLTTDANVIKNELTANANTATRVGTMLSELVENKVNKDAAVGGGGLDAQTVSVKTYGATGNGTTDDKAAFDTAVATGKNIYVPSGTYNLSAAVVLLPNQRLYGEGRRSIIKQVNNARGIWVKANCEVANILFKGAGKAAGLPFNSGIFLADCVGFKVRDCWFEDFSGEYGNNGGGGIFAVNVFTGVSDGGQITNCFFRNNNAGLMLAERSEFVTISQCTFGGNTTGLGVNAGNLTISNCILEENATNIKIGAGTNAGHNVISNTICNHATSFNLVCDAVPNGMIFLGCAFNIGNISILNSPKMRFIGCDFINSASYTLTVNASDIYIYNSRYPVSPTAAAFVLSLVAGGTVTQANNLDF